MTNGKVPRRIGSRRPARLARSLGNDVCGQPAAIHADLTEAQWIAKAKKNGKRAPPMPWDNIRAMTTQDLRAIYRLRFAISPAGDSRRSICLREQGTGRRRSSPFPAPRNKLLTVNRQRILAIAPAVDADACGVDLCDTTIRGILCPFYDPQAPEKLKSARYARRQAAGQDATRVHGRSHRAPDRLSERRREFSATR